MKLFKYRTKKTFNELVNIFENVPLMELESIFSSSKYFQHVDFTDVSGKSGFFAILADSYQSRIEDFLIKYEICLEKLDVSKDVFYDNQIDYSFIDSNDKQNVIDLVKNFKENYTTSDDVLDKILEKGIDSISEFDKYILSK